MQKNNNPHTLDDFVTKNLEQVALQIHSSNYQIQFIEWFFGKHKKKQTKLETNGAFTIVEKSCFVNWSKNNPKVEQAKYDRNITKLKVKTGDIKEYKIFVSQPFTIVPENGKEDIIKRKGNIEKSDNRYIGIDIGEYGLAYSLIKANGKEIEQLENGFINDEQQQALKKNVKSWRRNQVRQTFTSPDTKIARLRESLIGSYRNQLDSLALEKNATLSFEYEVSGFEAGGNRVAKIYDSIKRDVVRKKDNYSQNDQSWGKKGLNNWAFETTAAGTSQFCTKCKRWSSLAIEDNKDYKLKSYEDGLFKITITNGEIRLLGKEGMKVGDNIKGKNIKSLIYKAMRPPMDGKGMKIVKEKLGQKFSEIEGEFGPDKKYGNMAIFVCPYTDCHHISHADKQAAFNIAVRGYIKDIDLKNNEKEAKKLGHFSKEYFIKEESILTFNPIEL